jgi:hypothetical protein
MTTLLAIYFMTSPSQAPVLYKADHCYCDDSEFAPRCIKILEVGKKEYRYQVLTQVGYMGNFNNSFDTINDIYNKEVSCK